MKRSAASIRRRALRAARAVTMTFAVASASASCGTADTGELDEPDGSPRVADARMNTPDTGVRPDTSLPDTGVPPGCKQPDGVCPSPSSAGSDPDCCAQSGGQWFCDGPSTSPGSCAVPGPFVPPAFDDEAYA